MLAVLVQHNTGHGEVANLALLIEESDEGLAEAVLFARSIEQYKYQFYSNDIGVYVIRVEPGCRIWKNQQNYLFIRRFYNKTWSEEWYDKTAQKRFEAFVPA